jgi:hypothetical protein
MENSRKKAFKKEQYESLKKDTDQLLALATELKQDVDKTTENTLSVDVIKKTEEVEKLAKKVREKMRGYGDSFLFLQNLFQFFLSFSRQLANRVLGECDIYLSGFGQRSQCQ